ncbi:hypothetical protein RDABS01_038266 [Bienertia sinuspersici]
MSLFGDTHPNKLCARQEIMECGRVLTEERRRLMEWDFTQEDVRRGMLSIPYPKSPGLDGFNSFLFKKHWDIVGDEVAQVVLEVLGTGKILKEINVTSVTLIPKSICPHQVMDCRPVECCGLIYKCITKLIAKKLNRVFPDVISYITRKPLLKVGVFSKI